MIIEFSITNFGSIREKQTLSFEATKDDTLAQYYTFEPIKNLRLLKLAMIFGPNASGKSTVLKALEFLRDLVKKPAQNNSDDISFEPFLLDSHSKNQSSFIELLFIQEGIKYRYNVEFSQKCILSESLDFWPKGREALFFKRKTNVENQTADIEYGNSDLIKADSKNRIKLEATTLWNNSVLGTFSKANIDFKELKSVYNWFEDYLMPMVTPKTNLFGWTLNKIDNAETSKSEVINLLKFADVQINNVNILKKEVEDNDLQKLMKLPTFAKKFNSVSQEDKKIEQINIEFIHTGKNDKNEDIPIRFLPEQVSQGTLRYFGLGGVLSTLITKQKAIAIDEFESSLHPDLAQNFILRFLVQSTNAQLLVTTHNIDFLGEQDVIRRDAIWFTQKNKNGATELYSAADFDTKVLRKTASLLNFYEAGKFGAKPNLGSVFS
jgi:AAA15 family ATPase/GTPase